MTVFIKKYQNKNEKMEKQYRKWYGRTVIIDNVQIEQLADEIQDNCTVKRSDILAVLSELGPAIKKELQRSMKVSLPYLGSFKLAVHSTGVDDAEEFDVQRHIKSLFVKFIPELKVENKHRLSDLVKGARMAELPKNIVKKDLDADSTDNTDNGNNGNTTGEGAIEDQL